MTQRIASCLVAILLLLGGTGCAEMRQTFEYHSMLPPAATPRDAKSAKLSRPSCSTGLRVAVKPFDDARTEAKHGEAEFSLWMAGAVAASFPFTLQRDLGAAAPVPAYAHDDRRLYAATLWSELVRSRCFAVVGFDPEDESQYDLIFSGTIRRVAFRQQVPFVPVPLFFGAAIASGTQSIDGLLEIDLEARMPGAARPFLRYGLQGFCDSGDCSLTDFAKSASHLLRTGNAAFIAQLSSYLRSRSPAYWADFRLRRRMRDRWALDPELVQLQRARDTAAPAARAVIDAAVGKKHAALDAVLEQEAKTEMAWAMTSKARIEAEIADGNQVGREVADAAMTRALLGAALSAGVAAASGPNDPKTVERRYHEANQKLAPLRDALTPKPTGKRAVAGHVTRGPSGRDQRWLAKYRATTGSADSIIAKAKAAAAAPVEETKPVADNRGARRGTR